MTDGAQPAIGAQSERGACCADLIERARASGAADRDVGLALREHGRHGRQFGNAGDNLGVRHFVYWIVARHMPQANSVTDFVVVSSVAICGHWRIARKVCRHAGCGVVAMWPFNNSIII